MPTESYFALIVSIVLLITVSVFAVEYTVDDDGPADYSSIQLAINDSNNGDVITVMPGTYVENIDFSGKAVTLQSSSPTDSDIVLSTIIDGNGIDSCVRFDSGEDTNTVLNGFFITNGGGYLGGGIYCQYSSPTITNCIISGNILSPADTQASGGGMYCQLGSPTVTNCTFSGNMTSSRELSDAYSYGGAIYCYFSDITITNCVFSANLAYSYTYTPNSVATKSYSYGGAIYCSYGNPTITGCEFNGNSAASFTSTAYSYSRAYSFGGAISCRDSNLTITDCTFSANTANATVASSSTAYSYSYGGAMYFSDSNNATIRNCTISGNSACSNSASGIYAYGGGIYDDASYTTIFDTAVFGNYKVRNGVLRYFAFNQIEGNCLDGGGNTISDTYPLPGYDGDLDGDGDVDFEDFALMAADWLAGTQ
ncbi:MAG: hypothetical protein JW806_03200 [Sedimentisphaerales bacterium]|nr:hypothetical protein [Sedimentisphaerales bacterium]